MSFIDKLKKSSNGGYIFLSHSHDDIDKVRQIRNLLEKDGFEPLCFYLKCLDDDSEIEDLIKREIDAREWFVFINSANARKSKWVALEREYISQTDSKKIITIDIDDENSVDNAINKIKHNLRIFVSYCSRDTELARRIKENLVKKDYLVFFAPDSISPGANFASTISNAIIEVSKHGCVLALITENTINSIQVKKELMLALREKCNVIPVIIGDVNLDQELRFYLSDKQFYALSSNPTNGEINTMIDKIGQSIAKQ